MEVDTKVQDTLNAIWGAIAALNRRVDTLEDKIKRKEEQNVSLFGSCSGVHFRLHVFTFE